MKNDLTSIQFVHSEMKAAKPIPSSVEQTTSGERRETRKYLIRGKSKASTNEFSVTIVVHRKP